MIALNKVMLLGYASADPISYNDKFVTLIVETVETFIDKQKEKQTFREWHRLTFYGKLAKYCLENITKGTPLYVEGRLNHERYHKDGNSHVHTKITVSNVQILNDLDVLQ